MTPSRDQEEGRGATGPLSEGAAQYAAAPGSPTLTGVSIDLLHLAEDSADGIAVFDSAGTYLFVNREAERVLGRPRAEVLGHGVADLFPELGEVTSPFTQHFREAVEGRALSHYEAFNPVLGRWLDVRFVPCSAHRTVSGDERGVTVYFRDVTERHEAERGRERERGGRAESEVRFRTLGDAAPVLIWTSGTNGACDWFNKPWLDFTGRTMEQEAGYGWAEGVHPEDQEGCIATYRAAFDLRQPFMMEYRLRRHDGEYRWVLDNGVPRHAERGPDAREFIGYIGSCIDIHDKKAAEERATALIAQQRAFLRDVLAAVTEGVLRLCDSEGDLPARAAGDVSATVPLPAAAALKALRREAERVAGGCDLPEDRVSDLLTAASEAAMNVVTHAAGRGEGRALCDRERGRVQVWVTDAGPGIPLERLHRAVLERGFSTADSLGHGFWLMLRTADRVYLLTGPAGTTVVIEKGYTPPEPDWLRGPERV